MPLGVNFRSTSGYVTDPAGFVAQTDSAVYSPSRGYGYIATGATAQNRSTSVGSQLAGCHQSSSATSFRIDLPSGAGRYKVHAAFCDASSSSTTGFRFYDGRYGAEIAQVKYGPSSSYYGTISGNSPANSDFSRYSEDYVEHEFEADHVYIERDTTLVSGTGSISSVWFSPVGLGGEKMWWCPSVADTPADLTGSGYDGTYVGGMGTVRDTIRGGSRAFAFDGSNDYITTSLQSDLNFVNQTRVFTISAWFQTDHSGSSSSKGMLGNEVNTYLTGFGLIDGRISGSVGLKVDMVKSSGGVYQAAVNDGVTLDSSWHHVTATGDGSTLRIYKDGVLAASTSMSSTSNAQSSSFVIGAVKSSGSVILPWNGRLDDIRIFERTITDDEISHLSSARGKLGTPAVGLGGERLWICPSISDSPDDISGHGFTGTYVGGMGTVADTDSGGTRAFAFDGVDDYVSTDAKGSLDFMHNTGIFTACAWVKLSDGSSSASEGIIGSDLNSTRSGFCVRMSSVSEGLRGDLTKGGGGYAAYPSEGSAWPDYGWHHVAFVCDRKTATLYRDGSSVASMSISAVANTRTFKELLLGAYYNSGSLAGLMTGRLDDVRIFDRPLSSDELSRLSSSRGVQGPVPSHKGLGDERIWICPTLTQNASDISLNGETATITGTVPVVASTGNGGTHAFDFPNSGSSRLTIDSGALALTQNRPYALSMWVKRANTTSTGYATAKKESSGTYTGWALLGISQKWQWIMRHSHPSYSDKIDTPSVISTDWQHVVVVYDGENGGLSSYKIFVDGESQTLTASQATLGNNSTLNSQNARIGGISTSTAYYTYGQIDDYRIFDRAITDAEVAHLYTARGVTGTPKTHDQIVSESVTYYPLQEEGTTFYCSKTNIAGTLSDIGVTGRNVAGPTEHLYKAVQFSSTYQRRITLASVPSGIAGATKYTIAAWVKSQISGTAQRTVVGWDNGTTATSYSLRTHNGTSAKGPDLHHAGSAIIQRNTQNNTGVWQHVVVQVDTSTGTTRTYLDGQLDAEATGGSYSAVNGTLANFAIGATLNGGAANWHDAAICGVGVWDKILTASEINALYSGYGKKLTGLGDELLWISPSRTSDRSNIMYPAHADTELNGSLTVSSEISEGGTQAIVFSDQYSTSNYLGWDNNNSADPVTVSFWLEGSALHNAYDQPTLIGKSGSGSLRLHTDPQDMNGNGTLGFSQDSNWHSGTSWAPYSAAWHHVAVVRDYGTSTKFYVDGSLVHTGSADDTTAGDWDAAEYFIGIDKATNYADNNFLGKIDDLRVIPRAATASEVWWLSRYRGVLGGPSIECESASFALAGNAAALTTGTSAATMSAATGSFVVTGQAAQLKQEISLAAGVGAFAVSGVVADDLGVELNASVQTYVVTGSAAGLETGTAMSAATGSFAVSGVVADDLGIELNCGVAAFSLSGSSAGLIGGSSHQLSAGTASFSVQGQSAFLGLTFRTSVATFQVTGTSLPPLPGSQRPTPYYYRFLMQDE